LILVTHDRDLIDSAERVFEVRVGFLSRIEREVASQTSELS
jgi:ABC-type lipoprotein export system ATPase subunit